MKRRGLSFAEVLLALGILAMVLCGSLIFLQTNLVFYRHQIQAVRGAFLAQNLLGQLPPEPIYGKMNDFEYGLEVEATSSPPGHWLRLELKQGANVVSRQALWRPFNSRSILYQDYETKDWKRIEADGCAEETIAEENAVPITDGQTLRWRGVAVYESGTSLHSPEMDSTQRSIAFLQGQADEQQLWVLDLAEKKATCWLSGLHDCQPPQWTDAHSVILCENSGQIVKATPGHREVLYEGPALQQASVSPDGKRIAFVSNEGGNNDLFLYESSSKTTKRIVQTGEGEIRPLWSRDGVRILFGIAPVAGGTRLQCINADGTGFQDLKIVASGSFWKWR